MTKTSWDSWKLSPQLPKRKTTVSGSLSGLNCVLLMKENGFALKKARRRQYPAETITDVDYADDLVILVHTPAQA